MRARTLSFFIDREMLPEVMALVDEEILPRYEALPNFLGLILVDTEEMRREVLGMSVWDGELDGSDEVIAEFRGRVAALAGTSPTTKTYEVLRLVMSRSFESEANEEQT